MAGDSIRNRMTRAAFEDRTSSLSLARSFEEVGARWHRPATQPPRAWCGTKPASWQPASRRDRGPGSRDDRPLRRGWLGALLAEVVREEIDGMVTQPPRIVTSAFGNRGELMGAIVAAQEAARTSATAGRG